MSNYRFGLTTIGFWLILILNVVLFEGINFFANTPLTRFGASELILVSLLVAIPALIYYIIEKRKNKAKIGWGIFPIFIIFLFCGLFGIWFSQSSYTIDGVTFDYNVDLFQKLSWTIEVTIGLTVMYLAFAIFSKRILRVKSLRFILWLIVLAGIFCIVYSLATEFSSYQAIFLGEKENIMPIKSLFMNENSFGQMLLLSFFAVMMIDAIKCKWWHFIFFFILYAGLIFTTSYTSLLVASLGFTLYIVYLFFKSIKKHPYRNTILLSIYSTLIVGVICSFCFLNLSNVEFVQNLKEFIIDKILDKDYQTFTGRVQIWERAMSMLQTPLDFAFGKGYGNFTQLYHDYTFALKGIDLYHVDSTYVYIIGSYGILGLLTYASGIFALIVIAFYCMAKKRVFITMPALIILISLLVYDGFETYVLFMPNTIGTISFILIALPILIEFNHVRKVPYIESSLMTNNNNNHLNVINFSSKMIIQLSSIILSCLLLMCTINFVFLSKNLLVNTFVFVVLLLSYLLLPYLIAMWYKSTSHRVSVSRATILTLILFLIPVIPAISIGAFVNGSIELYLMIYVIVFAIILSIELVFTLVLQSNAKEFAMLIFKYTIRPTIIYFGLFLFVFIPTFYVMNLTFDFSIIALSSILILIGLLYLLSLYFLPNLKSVRLSNHIIVEQLNNRYLLKQKMVFVLNKI